MKAGNSLSVIIPVLVLLSCGEMNTIITPSASYRVGAKVDGRELEEGIVVPQGVPFRPLYVPQAANDPDVIAFKVGLRNSKGVQAATTIVYAEKGVDVGIDEATESLTTVASLSDALPDFSLPADLAIGQYSLVFQVVGKDGVLFEHFSSFYYIGDEEFQLSSLLSYPPGSAPTSGAPLFPVGMPLLVEAKVTAGDGLDPYIVWFSDGKRFSEGSLADGAGRVLWTPPSTAGFHRISVSLLPIRPGAEESESPGLTRTVTVATSTTAPYPGLKAPDSGYSLVYRFLATLNASDSEGRSHRVKSLTALQDEWAPCGEEEYGLFLDGRRSYQGDYPSALVSEGSLVPSSVVLRVAPRRAGTLFRAIFSSSNAGEGFSFSLSATATGFLVSVTAGESSLSSSVETGAQDGEFRDVKVEFGQPEDGKVPVVLSVGAVSAAAVSVPTPQRLDEGAYFVLGEGGPNTSGTSPASSDAEAEFAVISDIAFIAL